MRWLFSIRFHLVVAVSICALGTLTGWWFLTSRQNNWLHWLVCWLLVTNIVTFAYYGLDKWLASRIPPIFRIPEIVLHTLGAVGGSPAAFLAMTLFRHKTVKNSFRILFWGIVILQIALIAYLIKLLWWN